MCGITQPLFPASPLPLLLLSTLVPCQNVLRPLFFLSEAIKLPWESCKPEKKTGPVAERSLSSSSQSSLGTGQEQCGAFSKVYDINLCFKSACRTAQGGWAWLDWGLRAQKSPPALEIKPPDHSTCTADPGQFRKEIFSTQSLKIVRMHLEKGALNTSCGGQDVDRTHNHQFCS